MTLSIRAALLEEKRQKHLKSLINEAIVQLLSEQDAAAPPAPAAPVGMPSPTPPADDVSAPPTDPSAKEFTVDDMIERLNVVRGGRSFTDPEVYGQLVTYFKTLNDEQKTAMEKFLVDLGKIVINVNEQEAPPVPPAQPAPPPPAPPAPAAPAPTAPAAPPITPAV